MSVCNHVRQRVFFVAFFCATALGALVTTVDKDDEPHILSDAQSALHVGYSGYICGSNHWDLRFLWRCITYEETQTYRDADITPLDNADDNTLDSFTDVRGRGAGQMVPTDKPRAIVHRLV